MEELGVEGDSERRLNVGPGTLSLTGGGEQGQGRAGCEDPIARTLGQVSYLWKLHMEIHNGQVFLSQRINYF